MISSQRQDCGEEGKLKRSGDLKVPLLNGACMYLEAVRSSVS